MSLCKSCGSSLSFVEKLMIETVISAADEILKFKQLMDAGIITEQEFEAKKKQLLGLC